MVDSPSTYTNGPKFLVTHNVTKGDMVNIINELNEIFKPITFEPEPITEGGLIWKGVWGFKTIRLCNGTWPHVYPDWRSTWPHNDEVIFHEGNVHCTTLKAFYGAPKWTMEEIDKFSTIFSKYGLKLMIDQEMGERLAWYK